MSYPQNTHLSIVPWKVASNLEYETKNIFFIRFVIKNGSEKRMKDRSVEGTLSKNLRFIQWFSFLAVFSCEFSSIRTRYLETRCSLISQALVTSHRYATNSFHALFRARFLQIKTVVTYSRKKNQKLHLKYIFSQKSSLNNSTHSTS